LTFKAISTDSGARLAAASTIHRQFVDLTDLVSGRLSVVHDPFDLGRSSGQLALRWVGLAHRSVDTPLA
jgi:hypothetical protein